uniref:Creatinine amidohydrolase n=1 Tax=uncultured Armatimonadetes bacterium TaxID=157466 RepID=A0A6J4J7S6_9BACT|nr:Creatinine amidohydrolase [uncultured Armatimonadetes bacterium]
MIDGRSTTDDWQRHSGRVCVLPVGSFEQHGAHLPLATDILCAEFFAGMLADELSAALLPALPFGTCMEHGGFRGSVSLRPETLMQILRDVADEVERQQFRVLVVVNGHGGNFALAPVVRDINRRDRPLKLLLVDWWEQAQPGGAAAESAARGLDLHAGEMETSVVLAMRPDLVRPHPMDRPGDGAAEAFPLAQRDLNSFGVGHFSPGGVVGYPSLASAEKGQALIDSVRARLVPFVRDRIRRLTEQPRYAGGGGIAVRAMGPDDVPDGMRLKTLAGWNQTEADWRLFLEGPCPGGFVAVQDGRVVGTVAVIRYGEDLAWIGMMLVDPAFRRLGIGRLLLEHAVAGVAASGRAAIKLDATPAGKALYDTMGFVDESRLHRLTHANLPPLPEPAGGGACAAVTEEDWPGIDVLDRSVFGADRGRVLRALAAQDPPRALRLTRAGRVEGFCFARPGSRYHQIGPIVAGSVDDAILLSTAALRGLGGRPIVLDVPDAQAEFLRRLAALGFARDRSFVRMARAPAPPAAPQDRVFAICGPEFG